MSKKLIALAALVAAVFTSLAQPALAREWTNLNAKPLQDPFNPIIIRAVIHRFSILPRDVAEELAALVIAGRGRHGVVCKGDQLAGMSFGRMEVWDEFVTVGWTNVPASAPCKPATYFETVRNDIVFGVVRVHACKNLGPTIPWRDRGVAPRSRPPSSGPILGLIPPADCPPRGGQAVCC